MKQKDMFISLSTYLVTILIILAWLFIFIIDKASLKELFNKNNFEHSKKFLLGLLGFLEEKPAFLDINSWKNALILTFETFVMSVIAISLATLSAFFTVIFAAFNFTNDIVTKKNNYFDKFLYYFIRLIYIFSRAIPELLWALIIVFVLKPGLLAGAIALAIHNFGILGKLCSEVIENLDSKPLLNLASCGATKTQIFFYGILPSVYDKFIEYILYRFEIITRTTIVVGFIGAGGLGQQFKLSMSYFNYSEITLLLLCYFILVKLTE